MAAGGETRRKALPPNSRHRDQRNMVRTSTTSPQFLHYPSVTATLPVCSHFTASADILLQNGFRHPYGWLHPALLLGSYLPGCCILHQPCTSTRLGLFTTVVVPICPTYRLRIGGVSRLHTKWVVRVLSSGSWEEGATGFLVSLYSPNGSGGADVASQAK